MNAEAPIQSAQQSRWQRRLGVTVKRWPTMAFIEIGAALALVATLAVTYFTVRGVNPDEPLTPEIVTALLVANLLSAMVIMVLGARRLAIRRAKLTPLGGRGRLHVRLVALFSIIASVPTLLVVVFASLLFQGGMQFWFSENASRVLSNAENVSQIYTKEHQERIELDVRTMGGDVVRLINAYGTTSETFTGEFVYQTIARQLVEAAVLTLNEKGDIQIVAAVDLSDGEVVEQLPDDVYNRRIKPQFTASALERMKAGQAVVFATQTDRMEALVRLDPGATIFLYGAREVNAAAIEQIEQARTATSDYRKSLEQSRNLQLRFNVILLLISLFIVGLVIWIALTIADRLVRPVGELVDAAKRVATGDLSARVPVSLVDDEVSTLGSAFNRMTGRLEEQTNELVSANSQLDSRRAFIEAVLSGVTAGIISVDRERRVRLINSSAEALLKTGGKGAVGQALSEVAPELDAQLDSDQREDIIQFASGEDPRTLAVKHVRVADGHVITFDDITDQLTDQRRAAWSDVARRIAHEIKNPLTPIQLAAERLQRRYGKEISSDGDTFEQLTGTIVRQVGDLRRMVDEFSSFARMPKPVFRAEAVAEIARQALFLHEVAHPEIVFSLEAPEPSPILVCDRRQLGQALTNIVKNAVEAIQQKRDAGRSGGEERISVRILEEGDWLTVDLSDTGIGLPAERGRLTEPYMTTRAKGTGLGLAIVKKIVEEHCGRIEFDDAPGGGTTARLVFDKAALERLRDNGGSSEDGKATG